MSSIASSEERAERRTDSPLLRATDVVVEYGGRRGLVRRRNKEPFRAVNGVSIAIEPGETVGLVGESGSGKTSLGNAILRRVDIASGSIEFGGVRIDTMKGKKLRRLRRDIQAVFQNPYSSLNPRMRIGESVAEPMLVHGLASGLEEAMSRVTELLELCGMPPDSATRTPMALSGGQRQRVAIARALAVGPKLIVADEPTSALDVSVQAQIVALLQDLQKELGIAFLFISHDLAVVRWLARRVAIMQSGEIVESGDAETVFSEPQHEYTRKLIDAVPGMTR